MELQVGKVYRFWKNTNWFWVVRIEGDKVGLYDVTVLDKGSQKGLPKGATGVIGKSGTLFNGDFVISIIHTWDEDEDDDDDDDDDEYVPMDTTSDEPFMKVGQPKKRRTKQEIEMDNFIQKCFDKHELRKLYKQADEALDANDQELFIKIARKVAKLKGKVSA